MRSLVLRMTQLGAGWTKRPSPVLRGRSAASNGAADRYSHNETSLLAATRTDLKRKWLSGFDLCNLTSGSARYFERIGAETIQRICVEDAQKRSAAKRRRLRWRVSRGARRSLGWVPFVRRESL